MSIQLYLPSESSLFWVDTVPSDFFDPFLVLRSSKAPGRIVNEFGQTSGCPGEAIQPGHLFKILFQNESFLWTWTPQFRNHGLPICDRLWPKHMFYVTYRRWRWNWLPVKPESFFWAVLNNCRTPNRMSETLCQKRDTFRHSRTWRRTYPGDWQTKIARKL